MKKVLAILLSLTYIISLFGCTNNDYPQDNGSESTSQLSSTKPENDTNPTEATEAVMNYKDFKAIWLSQFDLQIIYSDEGSQRPEKDFEVRMTKVLKNAKANAFNTVILQIRPNADSFYPSEYYPPSKYVTGSYANGFKYDPIPFIIDTAHSIGLSIHAWINPLRAMTTDEIKDVNEKYLIKKWYKDQETDKLVEFNGRYYFNPASEDVRNLIINGVSEILDNYNFDGIHMDDYFYPTTSEAFDSITYSEYKSNGGTLNLKQYRYDNLNKLVSGIYASVKSKNENILYGISPEGNMQNATDKAYADVYTWCSQDGYIDYICPQIYFGLEHQTCPFVATAKKWANIIKSPNVDLIIGMTLGKAYSKTDKWAGSGKDEWAEHNDILKRCLEATLNINKCSGVSVFCYQYYYVPSTSEEVKETFDERTNFTPLLRDIFWN